MSWQVHKNIFFTKGFNRTLVFDSLLSSIKFVPNELYNELEKNNFVIEKEVLEDEFFIFLKENDIVFQSDINTQDKFINVSTDTSNPYDIGVCVIELSNKSGENLHKIRSDEDVKSIIGQFNFIFSDFTSLDSLVHFINFISTYDVDLIELTIYDGFSFIDELFYHLKDVNKSIIVNNFTSKLIEDNYCKFRNRMFSNNDIKSLKIHADLYTYFDSKYYNVYYYNKIFINKKGEIKNSAEVDEIFGNLTDIDVLDLKKLKNNKCFTKYWLSTKTNTLVCSDCEFNRLCSDNRLPKKSLKNEVWTHSEECQYNPYISKWHGEEGYVSLNNSGVTIKNDDICIDAQKLSKINHKLWEVDQ